MIPFRKTVRKPDHDREYPDEGKHLVCCDVTISEHKQQSWKVQTGLQLQPGTSHTNDNSVIGEYYLTPVHDTAPPPPVPNSAGDMSDAAVYKASEEAGHWVDLDKG